MFEVISLRLRNLGHCHLQLRVLNRTLKGPVIIYGRGVGRVHMEFHDISYGPPFILNVSCSAPLCNELYTCDPPFPPMHGSIHMSNIVRSDDVGHCKLHLGVWVCWKPPNEFRSEPWWQRPQNL